MKKNGTSPTQRTKKYLQEEGYKVEITERWNPYAKIRQDLFGWQDMIGIRPGVILGVQTTSTGNMPARVEKVLENELALDWLSAGGKILVIGWAKRGAHGERKVWTCKERWLTEDDFMER